MTYKQISRDGFLVSAPLKPCPWCKKTPSLWMPFSEYMNTDGTWVWKIRCCNKCEVSVSIRKTSKRIVGMFLLKLDELFDRWNKDNPMKAYEKKIIDLREVPTLGLA